MSDKQTAAQADAVAQRDAEQRINASLERARRFGAQIQIAQLDQLAAVDVLVRLLIAKGLVTEERFVRLKVERMADALDAAISEIAAQANTAPGIPSAQ